MSNTTDPFPQAAFQYLASAEGNHWWFRSRNQLILWVLKSKIHGIKNFIEVGCGTGYVLSGVAHAFPSLDLEASEYFEDGLVYARQRVPQCRFRQLDATLMSDSEAYDCIGAFDVIEHIEADQVVLANLARALRSGGFLLLTVPQHTWLWSAADDYAHHVRRYSRSELMAKVNQAGLNVSYCSSFVSLLLPLMALQRLSSRKRPYQPDDEFAISRLLNNVLRLVMRFELLLMCLGMRFPAGGSLVLMARKK